MFFYVNYFKTVYLCYILSFVVEIIVSTSVCVERGEERNENSPHN